MRDVRLSLTARNDSFVSLPASLIGAALRQGQQDAGSRVLLELDAGKSRGSPVVLAWGGEQSKADRRVRLSGGDDGGGVNDTIELSAVLARSLRLAHGQRVAVKMLAPAAHPLVARSLHLAPVGASDWDLVNEQASFVEDRLLAQCAVLRVGSVWPVWLPGGRMVHLRVQRSEPAAPPGSAVCIKGGFTEMVVEPPAASMASAAAGARSVATEDTPELWVRVVLAPADRDGDRARVRLSARDFSTLHEPRAVMVTRGHRRLWEAAPDALFRAPTKTTPEQPSSVWLGPVAVCPSCQPGHMVAELGGDAESLMSLERVKIRGAPLLDGAARPAARLAKGPSRQWRSCPGFDGGLALPRAFVRRVRAWGEAAAGAPGGVAGALLLHGPPRSGRSAVGLALLAHLSCPSPPQLPVDRACFPVPAVQCGLLAGQPAAVARARLARCFEAALAHRPSCVFLDDLDLLVAAPGAHAPGAPAAAPVDGLVSWLRRQLARLTRRRVVVVVSATAVDALHPALAADFALIGRRFAVPALTSARLRLTALFKVLARRTGRPVRVQVAAREMARLTDGMLAGEIASLCQQATDLAVAACDAGSPAAVTVGRTHFRRAVDLVRSARSFAGSGEADPSDAGATSPGGGAGRVGGMYDVKRALAETLAWPARFPALFRDCRLKLAGGALLYGFPGTGKSALAATVGRVFGLRCVSVKGPELLDKYIGQSERAVRDLFERARAAAPALLFFDEFDALAPRRGADRAGVTDRVVNQLLAQLDGVESRGRVFVLAATSRPDLLDPALLRPGRLDRLIHCPLPDAEERAKILHALAAPPAQGGPPPAVIRSLARRFEGASGADLQALVASAQLERIHERSTGPAPPAQAADEPSSLHHSALLGTAASAGSRLPESVRLALASLRSGVLPESPPPPTLATVKKDQAPQAADDHGHWERALAKSKPSLTPADRRKLSQVYAQFQLGREPPPEHVGNRQTLY